MRVYLSGPISNNPTYIEDFYGTEELLIKQGLEVINPVKVSDAFGGLSYEEYIKLDLILLEMCDAIFMLDGWQGSRGAKLEYHYANIMQKQIIQK